MRWQAPYPLPGNVLSLVAKGLELPDLCAFGITTGMTCETQRRRRSPGDEIFFGALMAAGAGNSLGDVGFVRKLDGLFDCRRAPISPVTEGQANKNNCEDYDKSFHPRSCGHQLATTLLDPLRNYASEERKPRATILF